MDRYCVSNYWPDFCGPAEDVTDEEREAYEQHVEMKIEEALIRRAEARERRERGLDDHIDALIDEARERR